MPPVWSRFSGDWIRCRHTLPLPCFAVPQSRPRMRETKQGAAAVLAARVTQTVVRRDNDDVPLTAFHLVAHRGLALAAMCY